MENYYINWSRYTGDFMVFEAGGKYITGFNAKKEAEEYIKELTKNNIIDYDKKSTNGN